MPISRDAFQIGVPSSQDDGAEEFADAPDMDQSASAVKSVDRMDGGFVNSTGVATGDSTRRSEENTQAEERPQRDSKEDLTRLPPADPTSAEKKEAFGAAYPQRETHRSVATGRDVPQFTKDLPRRETAEINWEEAHAETEIAARRAQSQQNAAAEHLARIHDIVGLLIEMSEAHSSDGERKLRSLESKVAELEMRYLVNRSLP